MSDPSTTTSRSDVDDRSTDRADRGVGASSGGPPDWNNVPFAVGCARCGCDLHGLSDPTCPQCLLAFDWADAVPIERLTCETCGYHLYGLTETRCPECGESFTWDGALAAYHRKRIPRFEYQWRRRPVRSLIGTWFHTLRPGKFWRGIDIHDPPQIRVLLLMVAVIVVAAFLALGLLESVQEWFSFTRVLRPRRLSYSTIGTYQPWDIVRCFTSPNTYTHAALTQCVLCLGASFLTLLLFPQSMRLYKVRVGQIVRVWAYAAPMTLPLAYLISYIYAFLTVRYAGDINGWILLLVQVHVVWSLRCGYRTYLRMPHSLIIAISSQTLAVLLAGAVEMAMAWDISQSIFYKIVTALRIV